MSAKCKWVIAITVVLIVSGCAACGFFCSFSTKGFDALAEAESGGKVDKALLLAVIKAESGFDQNAVSEKGAVGLMQLMPETAAWIAEIGGETLDNSDLLNPAVNVKLGARLLRYLTDKFALQFAIAAYNAGEGNVSKWLSQGAQTVDDVPYPETRAYVKKVLLYYKVYKNVLNAN